VIIRQFGFMLDTSPPYIGRVSTMYRMGYRRHNNVVITYNIRKYHVCTYYFIFKKKTIFRGYDSDASQPDIGRLSALSEHSGVVRTYESIINVTSLNCRHKLYTLSLTISYLKNKNKIRGLSKLTLLSN